MQKQRIKLNFIPVKRMTSGSKAQMIMNNLARHFLDNEKELNKLRSKQKAIIKEIRKRAKDKSATFRTDRHEVQLAVWFREQLAKREKFEAAFGAAKLKKLKLIQKVKMTKVTVRDIRNFKK